MALSNGYLLRLFTDWSRYEARILPSGDGIPTSGIGSLLGILDIYPSSSMGTSTVSPCQLSLYASGAPLEYILSRRILSSSSYGAAVHMPLSESIRDRFLLE
ncbi:hypothetical protein PM082_009777 [Marasmius tenuissimus]|nr:hypothetical protein PM082_009777 [Marasmius tenuissimus]